MVVSVQETQMPSLTPTVRAQSGQQQSHHATTRMRRKPHGLIIIRPTYTTTKPKHQLHDFLLVSPLVNTRPSMTKISSRSETEMLYLIVFDTLSLSYFIL